jgi:hypothetical protein
MSALPEMPIDTPTISEPGFTPVHALDSEEEGGGWLPTLMQMRMAVTQKLAQAIGPDATGVPFHRGQHTSMRQGFGMVALVGLLASLPPIIALWLGNTDFAAGFPFLAAPVLSIVDLLTGYWGRIVELSLFGNDEATVQSVVGGEPWLWALGAWLGAPVRMLTLWLAGGLSIFVAARVFGARNTLPRFFAATSYAFLPLLLMALLPVSFVGVIALPVGLALFFVMYAQGVQIATQMEWGHVLITLLAPLVLYMILGILVPALVLFWV